MYLVFIIGGRAVGGRYSRCAVGVHHWRSCCWCSLVFIIAAFTALCWSCFVVRSHVRFPVLSVSFCNSVFFCWVGDFFLDCCADVAAILEIFFPVDVSGFFEAALLLICLNVHTLLFEVCDGGIRGVGISSTARRSQSVASPGGFRVLKAGSVDGARIVFR